MAHKRRLSEHDVLDPKSLHRTNCEAPANMPHASVNDRTILCVIIIQPKSKLHTTLTIFAAKVPGGAGSYCSNIIGFVLELITVPSGL